MSSIIIHVLKGVSADGNWEWGGCADNVQHGYKKSREFMDARYRRRSDLKTQVMLHNNEAGRLVIIVTLTIIDQTENSNRFQSHPQTTGSKELYAHRMQVSRTVGIVHVAHLLAKTTHFPRRCNKTQRKI